MSDGEGRRVNDGIDSERFHADMAGVRAEISAVGTLLAALTAEVRGDLAHGQRKLDDHETRLRSLEAAGAAGSGASKAVGRIVTGVIAVAGGGIGTAVWQLMTSHH